jgi:hypothetical protein
MKKTLEENGSASSERNFSGNSSAYLAFRKSRRSRLRGGTGKLLRFLFRKMSDYPHFVA